MGRRLDIHRNHGFWGRIECAMDAPRWSISFICSWWHLLTDFQIRQRISGAVFRTPHSSHHRAFRRHRLWSTQATILGTSSLLSRTQNTSSIHVRWCCAHYYPDNLRKSHAAFPPEDPIEDLTPAMNGADQRAFLIDIPELNSYNSWDMYT